MADGGPAATPPLVVGADAPRSVWVRAGHRSLARSPRRLSPRPDSAVSANSVRCHPPLSPAREHHGSLPRAVSAGGGDLSASPRNPSECFRPVLTRPGIVADVWLPARDRSLFGETRIRASGLRLRDRYSLSGNALLADLQGDLGRRAPAAIERNSFGCFAEREVRFARPADRGFGKRLANTRNVSKPTQTSASARRPRVPRYSSSLFSGRGGRSAIVIFGRSRSGSWALSAILRMIASVAFSRKMRSPA